MDGLRRRSPPGVLTVPSATGKTHFSFFMDVNTFFCIDSSGVDFRCVHLLHSSVSATRMSPFQIPPRFLHIQGKYLVRLLDQIDVISKGLSQK